MKIFPELQLAFVGGWVFILFTVTIQLINLFLLVPKDVRVRLLDRSEFSTQEKVLTGIAKLFSMILLLNILLLPLDDPVEIVIGFMLYSFGMVGMLYATYNFKNTPHDQPVSTGLYKISRNPQEVMLTIAFLGVAIAVSSWFLVIIHFISRVFNHFQILAQEKSCILQYGDDYIGYMKKIPRYLLFF